MKVSFFSYPLENKLIITTNIMDKPKPDTDALTCNINDLTRLIEINHISGGGCGCYKYRPIYKTRDGWKEFPETPVKKRKANDPLRDTMLAFKCKKLFID